MTEQAVLDPMEYIWERIPKNKEGKIHYLAGDIPYLYVHGFVDTERVSYKDWKQVFEDCKLADGTYIVDHAKFLSLRVYRYEGPTFEPFNPQKIREGEWTDDQLTKLYQLSIKPSSHVTEDIFWNSIKALKKQGLEQNGNLLVDKRVKTQMSYLIERFPTPRRRLEKEVSRIRKSREETIRGSTKNRNQSSFTAGQMESEIQIEKFKELENKSALKTAPQHTKAPQEEETIDIKSLRRPSGKISG